MIMTIRNTLIKTLYVMGAQPTLQTGVYIYIILKAK